MCKHNSEISNNLGNNQEKQKIRVSASLKYVAINSAKFCQFSYQILHILFPYAISFQTKYNLWKFIDGESS